MLKKILLTWSNWMLAFDFKKYYSKEFEIIWFDRDILDITNLWNIEKILNKIKPDLILNFAAYTLVDLAEDEGKKDCFEVNTLWVYNLAKYSNKNNIRFITISTDYVFDGKNSDWYDENDICNPINEYWLSKYLWEKLAIQENSNSIIIRTSWLYWWWKNFKNFVNTILELSRKKDEINVVNDQFWIPTYTKDLSLAIFEIIKNIENFYWKILHFSNSSKKTLSWFDFGKEIIKLSWSKTKINPCFSQDFVTKAKRPNFSNLVNNSVIKLRNWEEALREYLEYLD
jgi:dTDP-4-dehydrorhamnose reductase